MGLSHRFDLCRAYFSWNRDFASCSLIDLLTKIIRPACSMRAKSHILKIVDDDEYKLIYLRNIKYPFYWPKKFPLYNLYIIICESLCPTDWHYYEIRETQVKPGDIVLDCGAAEGLFSLKIMERAQSIAIEPTPIFIESLKKTFYENDRVQIVPYALSNREGQAYLSQGTLNSFITTTGQSSALKDLVTVKTTTIDTLVRDLGLSKVDYIKGDLESCELEVLQGGAQIIRDHKPKIALTTYHQGNNWREMRDFVLSLVPGYKWRVKGLSYLDRYPKPVMIHFWPA
jgi:FkbM family methyltransferase